MIQRLSIKNYALIQELEIEPSHQLNIITGETGAGKSIMLGAMGLLLGERADTKVLFDSEAKCVVEAEFKIAAYGLQKLFESLDIDYEEHTVIRREISPSGRSRAFVNDTPIKLPQLKEVGERLLDIHSQHDTLLLGSNSYQLSLLDAYAKADALIADYHSAYRKYQTAKKQYEKIQAEQQSAKAEFDFNKFQMEELDHASLDGIDLTSLEQEREKLANADQIKMALGESQELLSRSDQAVETQLKRASSALEQVAKFSNQYADLAKRLKSVLIEINDISFELEREDNQMEADPARAEELESILSDIFTLQKKHGKQSIEELIALRDLLREKVDQVLHFDESLEAAKSDMASALVAVMTQGEKLSQLRHKAVPKLQKEISELLKDLGMPNGKLDIQVSPLQPSPSGLDQVEFLFSANKGVSPVPLKNAASGGEFSRLMLALKYTMAKKTAMPTIIFDEIDTGISGEIAIKVGKILDAMSQHHQLISISHLPQIAAKGDAHYFVYKSETKGRTISQIKRLNRQDRILEIAEMIGGKNPSDTALTNAKELLGYKD